jgi:hypothetical protein
MIIIRLIVLFDFHRDKIIRDSSQTADNKYVNKLDLPYRRNPV